MYVLQKLLSSFKGLETVQAYDGSQTVASLPGQCPAYVPTPHQGTCHVLQQEPICELLNNGCTSA